MITTIGLFLALAAAIYLGLTAVLILTDRPAPLTEDGDAIDLSALTAVSYEDMPPLQPYTARDGAELAYRLYPSSAPASDVLILLHGSGWHSMQFHPPASALSARGAAHVITPDLRGHGFNPQQRGDVTYIGQLEDDLADLIAVARTQFPGAKIIVGGHSSGGGLAVRFAGGAHGALADAYLLLAPFLKYNAPTTRPASGGWAVPNSRRIAGLAMLNQVGISSFNWLTVIQFAMPQAVLDGPLGAGATTAYTYRLNTSLAPRSDYGRDLAAMQQPFLLVAGLADESFHAAQYEPTISQHTASGRYILLPETGHIDLLTTPDLLPVLSGWLAGLP